MALFREKNLNISNICCSVSKQSLFERLNYAVQYYEIKELRESKLDIIKQASVCACLERVLLNSLVKSDIVPV